MSSRSIQSNRGENIAHEYKIQSPKYQMSLSSQVNSPLRMEELKKSASTVFGSIQDDFIEKEKKFSPRQSLYSDDDILNCGSSVYSIGTADKGFITQHKRKTSGLPKRVLKA
jgi:hypothetical protein